MYFMTCFAVVAILHLCFEYVSYHVYAGYTILKFVLKMFTIYNTHIYVLTPSSPSPPPASGGSMAAAAQHHGHPVRATQQSAGSEWGLLAREGSGAAAGGHTRPQQALS